MFVLLVCFHMTLTSGNTCCNNVLILADPHHIDTSASGELNTMVGITTLVQKNPLDDFIEALSDENCYPQAAIIPENEKSRIDLLESQKTVIFDYVNTKGGRLIVNGGMMHNEIKMLDGIFNLFGGLLSCQNTFNAENSFDLQSSLYGFTLDSVSYTSAIWAFHSTCVPPNANVIYSYAGLSAVWGLDYGMGSIIALAADYHTSNDDWDKILQTAVTTSNCIADTTTPVPTTTTAVPTTTSTTPVATTTTTQTTTPAPTTTTTVSTTTTPTTAVQNSCPTDTFGYSADNCVCGLGLEYWSNEDQCQDLPHDENTDFVQQTFHDCRDIETAHYYADDLDYICDKDSYSAYLYCCYCNQFGTAGGTIAQGCYPCLEHQFKNTIGDTACTQVPSNSASNTEKSDFLCLPGYYRHEDQCDACQEGKYSTTQGATSPNTCKGCVDGKYQASTGQSKCEMCPENTYSNSEVQSTGCTTTTTPVATTTTTTPIPTTTTTTPIPTTTTTTPVATTTTTQTTTPTPTTTTTVTSTKNTPEPNTTAVVATTTTPEPTKTAVVATTTTPEPTTITAELTTTTQEPTTTTSIPDTTTPSPTTTPLCAKGLYFAKVGEEEYCIPCPLGQATGDAVSFDQACPQLCEQNTCLKAYASPYTKMTNVSIRTHISMVYGDSDVIRGALQMLIGTWEETMLDVNVTYTYSGEMCTMCPDIKNPYNVSVPYEFYNVDALCNPLCNSSLLYYNRVEYPNMCVFCDESVCENGKFLTGGECDQCEPCVGPVRENYEFLGHGNLDNNVSCAWQCKDGYFLDYEITSDGLREGCVIHTEPNCTNTEFKVRGTRVSDSYCQDCTGVDACEGMNLTKECSANEDTQCLPCSQRLQEGAMFVGLNCTQECITGYVMNEIGECQLCNHICNPGEHFTEDRANCTDCRSCDVDLPMYAYFLDGCTWMCMEGYVYEDQDCKSGEEQVLNITSKTPLCAESEYLSWGINMYYCEKCKEKTPPQDQKGLQWRWIPSLSICEWECLPGYYYVNIEEVVGCLPWIEFQAHMLQVKNQNPTLVNDISNIQYALAPKSYDMVSDIEFGILAGCVLATTAVVMAT